MMIHLSDDFQKYMIDLNDVQINKNGPVPLSNNKAYKENLENKCPQLKNATHISKLYFSLNMTGTHGDNAWYGILTPDIRAIENKTQPN